VFMVSMSDPWDRQSAHAHFQGPNAGPWFVFQYFLLRH
jgi:hypothetical protein